jgi:hypothetical protein
VPIAADPKKTIVTACSQKFGRVNRPDKSWVLVREEPKTNPAMHQRQVSTARFDKFMFVNRKQIWNLIYYPKLS